LDVQRNAGAWRNATLGLTAMILKAVAQVVTQLKNIVLYLGMLVVLNTVLTLIAQRKENILNLLVL